MRPYPIVPRRLLRFATLWFVIAVQALTPFVHADAGAVQVSHAGFLHGHRSVHGEATFDAAENGEQGVEVEVARMPVRHGALVVADAAMPFTAPANLAPAATVRRAGAGLSAVPPSHVPLPDHALPHALAPPFY